MERVVTIYKYKITIFNGDQLVVYRGDADSFDSIVESVKAKEADGDKLMELLVYRPERG